MSDALREQLLALDEHCFEQPASDWAGDIALPAELARFYREVGPCDCTLDTAGNPFFIPSLAKLWKQQAGYRWHGLTGEPRKPGKPLLLKAHLWKNAFHDFEHSLVGYITAQAVRGQPIKLYYAFENQPPAEKIQPYFFAGKIDRTP